MASADKIAIAAEILNSEPLASLPKGFVEFEMETGDLCINWSSKALYIYVEEKCIIVNFLPQDVAIWEERKFDRPIWWHQFRAELERIVPKLRNS